MFLPANTVKSQSLYKVLSITVVFLLYIAAIGSLVSVLLCRMILLTINLFLVRTRRRFDVNTTLFWRQECCYNFETTSCVYWAVPSTHTTSFWRSYAVIPTFRTLFFLCFLIFYVVSFICTSYFGYFETYLISITEEDGGLCYIIKVDFLKVGIRN